MDPLGGHLPRDLNGVPAIGGINQTSNEVDAPSVEDKNKALFVALHVYDPDLLEWIKMQQPEIEKTFPDNRYAYDGSGNMIYMGGNDTMGAATSDATWEIYRLTWSSGNMTRKQGPLTGSWDGRAALGW